MTLDDDWTLLGLEPTTDEGQIRTAYARALRSVAAHSDPAGAQALRQAYDQAYARLLAGRTTQRSALTAEHAEQGGDFLRELAAFRCAGDVDGAISAIDRLFADRPPDDRLLAHVGHRLFRTMALQKTLSARLFSHMVTRFGWRDARSRMALAYPAEHSVLLARVAAEDWHQKLLTQAAQPDGWIAAYVLARGGAPLLARPFNEAQQHEAQALLTELWKHGEFLLERFDGRNLAALREKIEGPPYVREQSLSERFNEAMQGVFGAFLKPNFWLALGKAAGSLGVALLALVVLIPLYPLARVLKWAFPDGTGVKRPASAPPAPAGQAPARDTAPRLTRQELYADESSDPRA